MSLLKIKVTGIKALERALKRKQRQLSGSSSVLVGYGDETTRNSQGTNYALYVHEDTTAKHDPGTQAKYLEEAPFTKQELTEIVIKSLKAGESLIEGLEKAGQLVLERSKPLVPVDRTYLAESGFVIAEDG